MATKVPRGTQHTTMNKWKEYTRMSVAKLSVYSLLKAEQLMDVRQFLEHLMEKSKGSLWARHSPEHTSQNYSICNVLFLSIVHKEEYLDLPTVPS